MLIRQNDKMLRTKNAIEAYFINYTVEFNLSHNGFCEKLLFQYIQYFFDLNP